MSPELRRARVAISLVFAVCGAVFATWAARVPAAQQRLVLSDGELALGLFGLAAGSVAALVLAGPLVTVVGSRAAVALGATVLCGGLPLVALAPGLPVFVAALVVLGVGNSLLDVAMNAHASRVEQAHGRPIFASFHAFWNIGGLAGAGIAALAAGVPLIVHFTVVGAALLIAAYLAAGLGMLSGRDPGQGERAFARPPRWLLPLGVIVFYGFLAEGTVNDWSAVQLTGATGASAAVASLGVSAIVPLAWSAAGRRAVDAPGAAIAAVATCGYVGFLVGPVLVGGVASAVGLPVAIAAVGLLAAVVHPLASRMRP